MELAKYTFAETDVQSFTLWGLSTENLKNRSQTELMYLFELYKKTYDELADFCRERQVNFCRIGSET